MPVCSARLTLKMGLTLTLLAAAVPTPAAEFVLTIGGGPSPFSNQISLEKNVAFFNRVLAETLPAQTRHDVYFSDGDDPGRDLQYLSDADGEPAVYDALASIFEETDHLGERYRNHDLPQVAGAATVANVNDWFAKVGSTLTPADRLLIYVTAHGGGSAEKKQPHNTRLYLWNDETLDVQQFAALLDTLPPELPVVIVMVQCHSGGFADLVFTGGREAAGAATHNRCGFFATTYDRPAAGCTADIDEDDYREYSSSFWAALFGRTRTDGAVENADFDGDGVVSFAEAHAAVLIGSDTIDIPLKTSDVLLRAAGKMQRNQQPVVAAKPDDPAAPITVTALRPAAPLSADAPIESLLAVADVPEQVVIVRLSQRLNLSRSDRAAEARELAKTLAADRKRLQSRVSRLDKQAAAARRKVKDALLTEWPELAGPWNAAGRVLVETQGDAVLALIESDPDYTTFADLDAQAAALEQQRDEMQREWVKCQRLLRTLESVALAHNLPTTAPDLLPRFHHLRDAEAATLRR